MGTDRKGRCSNLREAVDAFRYVLEMNVAAEIANHGIPLIKVQEPVGILQDIALSQQAVVDQEVLVAGGDDPCPAVSGTLQLLLDPGKCLARDSSGSIHRIGVHQQHPQVGGQLCYIAQRGVIPGQRLVIAEVPVEFGKLFRRDALCRPVSLFHELRRHGVLQVVVARNDQDGNAGLLDPLELFCQPLMTQGLAVEGQVPGEDQRVRCLPDHLPDERLQKLFGVVCHFPICVLNDLLKVSPSVCQLRCQVVQIRGDQERCRRNRQKRVCGDGRSLRRLRMPKGKQTRQKRRCQEQEPGSPQGSHETFSTAPAGQMWKQLPQWRQWLSSIIRGMALLMQPTGQTLRQP